MSKRQRIVDPTEGIIYVATKETREKISIQRRGRPLSEEHKRRIGIGVRRYLERQKEIS